MLFDSWKVLQVHGSFITRGMMILLVFRSSALSFNQRHCDNFCCYCCGLFVVIVVVVLLLLFVFWGFFFFGGGGGNAELFLN